MLWSQYEISNSGNRVFHNPGLRFYVSWTNRNNEYVKNDCLIYLKVVSATFLLVCFLRLKESTRETKKKNCYFTSKALFVFEIIKFNFSDIQMS